MTPRHNRVIIRPSSEGYDVGGVQLVPPNPLFFFSKIIKISSKQCFKKQEKREKCCYVC